MKSQFAGYYAPDEKALKALWAEGTFILDTSILLELYVQSNQARAETLATLRVLKDRLWIPYQVGLEFQRRRVQVIHDADIAASKHLEPIREALDTLEALLSTPEFQRSAMGSVQKHREAIKKAGQSIIATVSADYSGRVKPQGSDAIRDVLDELLDGRVGSAPSESDLKAMYKDAEQRFEIRMGPGWCDTDKRNAIFMHDGIRYDRQKGDYVVWRQSLDHVKASGIKNVVFVTKDKKEDWWLKYGPDGRKDEIWGPQPELCLEMRREGVERFWMLDLRDFLQNAGKHLSVKVSSTTWEDISDLPVRDLSVRDSVEMLAQKLVGDWGGMANKIEDGSYASVYRGHLQPIIDFGYSIVADEPNFAVGRAVLADGRMKGAISVPWRHKKDSAIGRAVSRGMQVLMRGGGAAIVEIFVETDPLGVFKIQLSDEVRKQVSLISALWDMEVKGYVGYREDYSLASSAG